MLCGGRSDWKVGVGGTGGRINSALRSGFDLTRRKDLVDSEGTTNIFVDFRDFSLLDFEREGEGVRDHAAILLRKLRVELFLTSVAPPPTVVEEYGVVCIIAVK